MKKWAFTCFLLLLVAATCGFGPAGDHADACHDGDRRQAGADTTRMSDPGDCVHRGDEHLLARRYDKAIAAYQAALAGQADRTDILQKLADAEMAAGRDEDATGTYRKLLRLDGKNNDVRYSLGVLYERQGMLDEAEELYLQVVEQEPNNGDARRHLADIYTLRGDFPRAIQEYRELVAERNGNPLLHFKLARVYDRGRNYRDAITEYLETIRLTPDNIQAHKELAALYLMQGQGAEAAEQYRMVLHLNSDDLATRNALVSLYVKLRKYDELFILLKEGAELFPNDPNSHFRLGLMYDFRKEYDASLAEYRTALALKSDNAKALKGMGKVFLETGRLEQARECLEAARKADPELLEAQELLNDLTKVEEAKKSRKTETRAHRGKKNVRHAHVKKKRSSRKILPTKKGTSHSRTKIKKKTSGSGRRQAAAQAKAVSK